MKNYERNTYEENTYKWLKRNGWADSFEYPGIYEIRIDESVKAIERMHTILGDVALGGNVIEHEGFVYFSTGVSAG